MTVYVSLCVNCLILDSSKGLTVLPILRKIGCATFKRKKIAVFVKDMTNVPELEFSVAW